MDTTQTDAWEKVFEYIEPTQLVKVEGVCKDFQNILRHSYVWKTWYDLYRITEFPEKLEDYKVASIVTYLNRNNKLDTSITINTEDEMVDFINKVSPIKLNFSTDFFGGQPVMSDYPEIIGAVKTNRGKVQARFRYDNKIYDQPSQLCIDVATARGVREVGERRTRGWNCLIVQEQLLENPATEPVYIHKLIPADYRILRHPGQRPLPTVTVCGRRKRIREMTDMITEQDKKFKL
jgi:hypothetical protein